MQDFSNSSALAMELLQSGTKQLIPLVLCLYGPKDSLGCPFPLGIQDWWGTQHDAIMSQLVAIIFPL